MERRGVVGPWVAMLAVAVAALALPRRAPRLDPAATDGGRRYDVRILRDIWGVPHLFGATDADAAFGLAWAHAEDDFDTIQLALLAARGTLAAEIGRAGAPNDYMVALMRVTDAVASGYPRLAPETRALVEAYADGLNRYAAHHPEAARARLYPVRGADVVAGFVHKLPLFFGLGDVLRGLLAPGAEPVEESAGSNTFAVAPERAADGWTRLAINSHQPWDGPVAWYEAHLHSETGWDLVGGTFPGAPLVLHGHNRALGWAHTVNRPDLIDVYALDLDPADPDRYRFDGEWRTLERRTARIEVKLAGPLFWTVERELLWSVHGPVLRTPRGAFAVRVAGQGEVRQVEQWYRMGRARSFDEWTEAMRIGAIPMFNTGYADARGHISYVYNARLPLRAPGYDWTRPVPGDRSATLWTQTLPWDALPMVVDPPSGFVQNANSTPFLATLGPGNPDPTRYPAEMGIEIRQTNRAQRLLELLGADASISREAFERIKFDARYSERSRVAERIRELASADAADADPRRREALALVRSWDLDTQRDDRAAALALLTLDPDVRGHPFAGPLPQLLERLDAAALRLRRDFGRLDVPWGEVQRLRRGRVDLGVGGAPDVLRAIYAEDADDGRRIGVAGDSYVLLVEWDPEGRVRSRSIHQYGSATADAASPHYADQAPLFVERRLKPVWMDESEIRAHLEREYRPPGPVGARR